jgi:hypothetical protein
VENDIYNELQKLHRIVSGATAAFDVTVSSSAAAVIQKTGNAIDLNQSGS